jgi:excisionase family DNA binding protein
MKQIILETITIEEFRQLIVETFKELHSFKEVAQKITKNEECNFLSRKELAKLLKVSLPTLHEWTKEGLLKSYRIGNRILFKECEVLQALTERNFTKFQRGGNHGA